MREAPGPPVEKHMGFSFASTTRGMGFGGLLFFTLFWCGITGVFVGLLAHSVYRALDAQRRYVETTGTVLGSGVSSHSGSDGTTYGFDIRYRYAVANQSYEAIRYAFGSMNSSDGHRHATELVSLHPSGSTIRVYYDPTNPAEAVVNCAIEPTMGFMFLFLQPFILIGLTMIVGCVNYPFSRLALNRFLKATTNDLPIAIPSWGRLTSIPNGCQIVPHMGVGGVIGAAAIGYGLTCFISIFIVGFFFGGFGSPNLKVVAGALLLALTIGVSSAIYAIRSTARKVRVMIDAAYRKLSLVRPRQTDEISFRDMAGWIVTQIENPRSVKQEGAPLQVPVLSIRKITNEDVPVHIFEASPDAPLIAAKCAEILSRLTDNKPVLGELAPEGQATPPTVAGVLDAIKKAAAKAKAMKDLT